MTSSERPRWTTTRTAPTVLTVNIPYAGKDWEQWFLLRSDAHHDNLHADHAMEKRHLDLALERGAGILDFGDLFCAMQGKWDKRADVDQLRPELVSAKYLDRLVEYNADFYRRYARNWILLARGNHETSIQRPSTGRGVVERQRCDHYPRETSASLTLCQGKARHWRRETRALAANSSARPWKVQSRGRSPRTSTRRSRPEFG